MIGWIIAGLLAASVLVIVVSGIIDKQKTKEALKGEGFKDAIVKSVDKTKNVITVEELLSGKKCQIEGDGISDEIQQGMRIYV